MNIKEAKEQIKNAMRAYFSKDEYGVYEIPIERQRPVFLMGAPGIGKTAIMEQIASELGVGLISYSMTHHTRQSAIGLPFITKKVYDGEEYDVSEYTMSEIIAAVYNMMEQTGIKEGILFLDEINCVSETLAPAMLQFLQYKIFGNHRVPDGWIVVTAGNPPEYNKSVREFDIVTWDRLKRIDVEANFEVWKEYAYERAIHPAVLTYLEIKSEDFYQVETTVGGKSFVTARGWEDLSTMIKIYEKKEIKVDIKLIEQYLQNKNIAKEFATYYDLFNKYRSDYQVDNILAGKADASITERAKKAKFDERLSLIGLMLDSVSKDVIEVLLIDNVNRQLLMSLQSAKLEMFKPKGNAVDAIKNAIKALEKEIENGKYAGNVSKERAAVIKGVISALEELCKVARDAKTVDEAFNIIKKAFDDRLRGGKELPKSVRKKLDNMFVFCENAFGEGQEILILTTELTANTYTAKFISYYGCGNYFKHNKELMLSKRGKDIAISIDVLEL